MSGPDEAPIVWLHEHYPSGRDEILSDREAFQYATVRYGKVITVAAVRLMSSLLATDRLEVRESCKGFIDEVAKGDEAPAKTEDHSRDVRHAVMTTEYSWSRWLKPVIW